jgi:uncharacterized membrane protein YhfC
VFTILASVVLPIAAAIWLALKKKGYLKPILLGVLCFGFFQVLTRIPVMTLVLPKMAWYNMLSATQPFLLALFAGGTAALFEEGGRWIVMRLWMKNRHRLNDGIAFGIGHGGLEAVLLVGINSVALLILNQYSTVTPLQIFAGGFERLCTLVVHVAFSVMVLKSVALKKPLWLLLAFVLHTVIDMAAVLMQTAGFSAVAMEAVVLAFSLLLLGYILFEYKKFKGGEFQCQKAKN